jgi:hypothetical protein
MQLMQISIAKSANSRLVQVAEALSPAKRGEMHQAMGEGLGALVIDHLRAYGGSHHATAQRLGATPTEYINKAVQNTSHSFDNSGASVTIKSSGDFDARGMHRARRELKITPTNKGALTIPLHALAYGRNVKTVAESEGITIFRPKGKNVPGYSKDGGFVALYALVQSARIPHDPGLLPGEAAIKTTAGNMLADFITRRRKP